MLKAGLLGSSHCPYVYAAVLFESADDPKDKTAISLCVQLHRDTAYGLNGMTEPLPSAHSQHQSLDRQKDLSLILQLGTIFEATNITCTSLSMVVRSPGAVHQAAQPVLLAAS